MSVSHLIQPYTTNFSSIGTSSVKHIKWIVRPMPQWVCTSSARANQQHWPTIYPAFPTTLVEAMWDVWCLFSIIAAMICIGSGWNAAGWTGTLHLVTHNQSYRNKALVHSQQRDPPLKGTVERVVFVAPSWVQPRIIRLETPMAELISWSPGLWLYWVLFETLLWPSYPTVTE